MGLKNFPGYRPQTSILKTVDEPKLKKPFNWDRLFFILLLCLVAFYGGRRLYRGMALIRVNGQVILEKISVNFTDDIRIKTMAVDEGDEVVAGDTLFTYVVEGDEDFTNSTSIARGGGNDNNWFLREKMTVSRQIESKKSDQEGLRTLASLKKEELEGMKQRVYLGTEQASKLEPLRADILELENEIASIGSEIRVLRDYVHQLSSQEQEAILQERIRIKEELEGFGSFDKMLLAYTTPITGLIGQIEKDENEVCYKGETAMTIHRSGVIKVKAYFPLEFADEVKIGDEVVIYFEDGTESDGIIQNFYISTYPLPPEFQKKYEPVSRSIVADVVPKNLDEGLAWNGYYKMSVTVVKHRFF